MKVYEVSRTCIMLVQNNRYLPLSGLLTDLRWLPFSL